MDTTRIPPPAAAPPPTPPPTPPPPGCAQLTRDQRIRMAAVDAAARITMAAMAADMLAGNTNPINVMMAYADQIADWVIDGRRPGR